MNYQVHIVEDAEKDLFEIYQFVATNDSPEQADTLLANLEETCLRLSESPLRGHIPPELQRVSLEDYLEIHYKTYRIIYQVALKKVYIHCVLDGRRDLEELLRERLLRPL